MRGELLDADRVGNNILLRHWRPGDRFQPIVMKRSVKLQNLFTNAKIPAAEKRQRVLACTEQGQLFWIQKFRISDLAKITPKTKRFLQWHWQPV
jgi:tRNA(Ile)-lysidine synthase